MPRKRWKAHLNAQVVAQAEVRSGAGEEYEIGDLEVLGLALRVRKRGPNWILRGRLRGKQTIWTIGRAGPDLGIREARRRAEQARAMLARGEDPRDWLREAEAGPGAHPKRVRASDGWTWEQGRDAFLEHVKAHRKPRTYQDYRVTLTSSDFDFLQGRLLRTIGPQDGRRLQDDIVKRGRLPMAKHALVIMKSCLRWCADRAGSGIEASPIAGVRPVEYKSPPGYVPEAEELGRLPWRLETASMTQRGRLAALLVLFTAQRIETVIAARRDEFVKDGERVLWCLPATRTKSGRDFVLPLSSTAASLVQQAMAIADETLPWLFPQIRARRSDTTADGHITYRAVTKAMKPLKPHDLRRAFATHCEMVLGAALQEIAGCLDHAGPDGGNVTRQRYALGDRTHYKWKLMNAWANYVLKLATEAAPPGGRLRILDVAEPEPKSVFARDRDRRMVEDQSF